MPGLFHVCFHAVSQIHSQVNLGVFSETSLLQTIGPEAFKFIIREL